nr:spidroin-1-like [Aegilops tauschii subsp. strangulata]
MGAAGVAGRGAPDWAPAATAGRRSKRRGCQWPGAAGVGAAKASGRGTRLVRRICGGAGGTGAGHGKRRPVAANGGRARRRELARERPGGEGGHRQARQCARVQAGETGRGRCLVTGGQGRRGRCTTGGWGCGSASSRAATGASVVKEGVSARSVAEGGTDVRDSSDCVWFAMISFLT